MGVPNLGIRSLEKIFLAQGYSRQDAYQFSGKKLDAFWYAPPPGNYPRIFISELRVPELSERAQRIIHSYTDRIQSDPVDGFDLHDADLIDRFLHSPMWPLPTLVDYECLAEESEYAAWVIYNRYYLNHFTISVHNLPAGYGTVRSFNAFLQSIGVTLNDAGGIEKTSGDGLLIQSSTVAQMVRATFSDGVGGTVERMIPGSYVEFAERRALPEFAHMASESLTREHRRDGFETANADRIFESTDLAQVQRSTDRPV